MATIDTLIQEILAPVEHSAARLAPKVLAWFESTSAAPQADTAWDWFDGAGPAEGTNPGLDIIEHQMPMEALCALFGLGSANSAAHALAA